MLKTIQNYMGKPALYAQSTSKFWDDTHISKGMLLSHLEPTQHGATNKHAFVRQSVQWIAKAAPVRQHRALLDLGCGPGIYAELFDEAGYLVTGLDLSERSVGYARDSAQAHHRQITYQVRDYLTLDYVEQFDIVTLINYDFGVLSTENRASLLGRIYTALKANGQLIFDVFTPYQYMGMDEYKSWEYTPGGFFSPEPHLCLNSFYRYDEQNTFLRQYLVVTEHEANCYNIWDHTFTESELLRDLSGAGFMIKDLYGDVAGNEYSAGGKGICVVAEKTAM
jgi:2-polyprenyl-3-methyl-5-hydroxy-6-metoxy-1,4-benzoquinol methylase